MNTRTAGSRGRPPGTCHGPRLCLHLAPRECTCGRRARPGARRRSHRERDAERARAACARARAYGRNLRPPCFAPKTFPGEIRTGSEMGKNTHEANSRAEGHEGKTSSAEAAGEYFTGERERETRARGGHPDAPSSRASLRQEARSGAPVPWKRRSSVKPTAFRRFQNKLRTLGVRVVNQQYVCSIQRLNSHPLHPIK